MSIVLHPITLGIAAIVIILIILNRRINGKDKSIYRAIAKINGDKGYSFPTNQSQCKGKALRDYDHSSGNLMFDGGNTKVAIIRSASNIDVHTLDHIQSWQCYPSGRSSYGNSIEFILDDLDRPRFRVSVPKREQMEDWSARLEVLSRRADN